MYRSMLKSKIHRATTTGSELGYEGSISIDPVLCEAAHMLEYERVEIYNCNNGQRFATYVIYGNPGEICVNGAAARLVQKGDILIIASYVDLENEKCFTHKPKLVYVNERNEINANPRLVTSLTAAKEMAEPDQIWYEADQIMV